MADYTTNLSFLYTYGRLMIGNEFFIPPDSNNNECLHVLLLS